jgi:uncharacterized membrane protein HdeD (DUF308 family)
MNKIKKMIKMASPLAWFALPLLALAQAKVPIPNPGSTTGAVTLNGIVGIINQAATYLMVVGVTIGVIFIVYGGLKYMLARGDAKKAEEARGTILHGFIGIVVVVAVGLILATANYVVSSLSGGAF